MQASKALFEGRVGVTIDLLLRAQTSRILVSQGGTIENFVEKQDMEYKVNVVFNEEEDGFYVYCLEFPECNAQGDTYEEAEANIRTAIEAYLSGLSQDEIEELLE